MPVRRFRTGTTVLVDIFVGNHREEWSPFVEATLFSLLKAIFLGISADVTSAYFDVPYLADGTGEKIGGSSVSR